MLRRRKPGPWSTSSSSRRLRCPERRAVPAVEDEDLTEHSRLVFQGRAAPESCGALPPEAGPPGQVRDDHATVERTSDRGRQTALPDGPEASLAGPTPGAGRRGMAQQPGKATAKARRISSRELRPPQPLPLDLHNSLETYVSRVPRASPAQQLQQRKRAHQPRRLLPGGIETAHIQNNVRDVVAA